VLSSSGVASPHALFCTAVQAPTLHTDPRLRFEIGHGDGSILCALFEEAAGGVRLVAIGAQCACDVAIVQRVVGV
jgi:hypothetical protein